MAGDQGDGVDEGRSGTGHRQQITAPQHHHRVQPSPGLLHLAQGRLGDGGLEVYLGQLMGICHMRHFPSPTARPT
ncbi:hypothetical protein [Streptomyces sp. NPDC055036]